MFQGLDNILTSCTYILVSKSFKYGFIIQYHEEITQQDVTHDGALIDDVTVRKFDDVIAGLWLL